MKAGDIGESPSRSKEKLRTGVSMPTETGIIQAKQGAGTG